MSDQPASVPRNHKPSEPKTTTRKDLRPALVIGAVVIYSVTVVVGAVSVVIVNVNGNQVARACIERGGEWTISDDGSRQCVRPSVK